MRTLETKAIGMSDSGNDWLQQSTNTLTRIIYLAIGLVTLMITILFCGISRDSEFYEPTIFVKHRPTLKIHFYTPTGESDLTISDLSGEAKREELLYKEFVEDQNVYADNSDKLWFLPPVLIQLTLTAFAFATTRQKGLQPKGLIVHFLINLIPTTVITGLMLFNETPLKLLGLATMVLMINIWTVRFTPRKSAQQSL